MKKNLIQSLAFFLSLVMCASVFMFPTFATDGDTSTDPTEPTTPETITPSVADGTLLLEVNDLSQSTANATTGAVYTPSVNTAVEGLYSYADGVISIGQVGGGTLTYGGQTNLALNENSKYTISYMQTLAKVGGSGLRISYASNSSSVGLYMLGPNACLAWGGATSAGYTGYKRYPESMKTGSTVFADNGYAKIDIEVNGYLLTVYVNDILFLKENISSPSNSDTTNFNSMSKSYMSETLSLVWHEYQGSAADTPTVNTNVKGLKVYSGLTRSEYATPAKIDGNILLEVDDLTSAVANSKTGVTYTPDISNRIGFVDSYYSYQGGGVSSTLSPGGKTTCTYGGETNLPLNGTAKYTVSYMVKAPQNNASGGMRIAYCGQRTSIGVYMNASQACIAYGVTTGDAYSGYKSFTEEMKKDDTVFYHSGGYAKVDIEIDGNKVTVYINEVKLLSEDITAPSNSSTTVPKQFLSDTLSLVWHEYHNSATAEKTTMTFKDVRVYSGHIISEKYIEMVGVEVGAAAEGKAPIRFSAVGSPEWYGLVGFEIIAEHGSSSDKYFYQTSNAYRKLVAADGFTAYTPTEGYAFAYTLYGVPTDISVTFTVTPYGYEQGIQYFGTSVTYTVENGVIK